MAAPEAGLGSGPALVEITNSVLGAGGAAGGAAGAKKEGPGGSSGLTRGDFDSAVATLARRIDEIKGQMYETINKNYKEFVQTYNYALDLQGEVVSLGTELESLTAKVKGGALSKLVKSTTEQRSLAQQLQFTRKTIHILEQLCAINDNMEMFGKLLDQGDLQGAAQAVTAARTQLVELYPAAGQQRSLTACDPAVITVVRAELRRRRGQLQSLLDTLWRDAICWQRSDGDRSTMTELRICPTCQLTMGSKGTTQLAPCVLLSLEKMEMLGPKLSAFSASLVSKIVQPLLANPKLQPVEKTTQAGSRLWLAEQQAKAAPGKKNALRKGNMKMAATPEVDLGSVYPAVLAVVQFALDKLFASSAIDPTEAQRLAGLLGAHLWAPLHAAITETCIVKCIPDDPDQGSVDAVLLATRQFEDQLIAMGLVGESDRALSSYVSNLEVHSVNRKRQRLLQEARVALMENNFVTVEVCFETERGGFIRPSEASPAAAALGDDERLDESLFRFPKCRISAATKSLMDMAFSTLDEMSPDEPDNSVQLFYAVRDMLDLFRAIVPYHHEATLATVPQLAAVFYNDCFYLAHHLLSLGHQFKGRLPESFEFLATFVDMVPAFRSLGEKCLLEMVATQRHAMLSCLQGADGFASTGQPDRFEAVQRALRQSAHQFGLLTKVWQGILPDAIYVSTIGSLLDTVLAEIIGAVLALEDISEQECHQLHRLLTMMPQKTAVLFPADVDLGETVASWSKYLQLVTFLEANLRTILDQWQNHELLFSADETRGLVRALFSNTDARAEVLAAIK